jgi:hypothetical protein
MNNQHGILLLPPNAQHVVLQLPFQNKLQGFLNIWQHTFSSTLGLSGPTSLVVSVFGPHLFASFTSKGGKVLVQASKLIFQSLYVPTRFIFHTQLPAHQQCQAHPPMYRFVARYVLQLNHVYGVTTSHTTCEENTRPSP